MSEFLSFNILLISFTVGAIITRYSKVGESGVIVNVVLFCSAGAKLSHAPVNGF